MNNTTTALLTEYREAQSYVDSVVERMQEYEADDDYSAADDVRNYDLADAKDAALSAAGALITALLAETEN